MAAKFVIPMVGTAETERPRIRHIDTHLDQHQADSLTRIVAALDGMGARLKNNRPVYHNGDAIKWILEQAAQADPPVAATKTKPGRPRKPASEPPPTPAGNPQDRPLVVDP